MDQAPEWFSTKDVKQYLSYEELIPAIETTLADFSRGHSGGIIQPVRITMRIEEHEGIVMVMPAVSLNSNAMATKILTRYPNLSTPSYSIIAYSNPVTGKPLALMDGKIITGMRTAAASAVATKYLAPENSKILAIIGSGMQAATHFHALLQVCKFEQVRVWSRSFQNAKKFAEQFDCVACMTVEETAKDADVIVTVTVSKTPVLHAEWVKEGAHVNCVGAVVKDYQELDTALMKKSDVYVDTKEVALKESGDVIVSGADILGEIGELVLGTKKANRNSTTVFKSLGMAIEDVVSAKLVYDKAHQSANL